MIPMYKGMNNSPETILTADVTAEATTIPLASVQNLPEPPNLCTLGEGDDAEVVRYNGVSGTSLTSVERGFGGTTAKAWTEGTIAARCFTEYDHETFIDNIRELQADVKRYGVRFTGSASAGERLYDAVGLRAGVGTDTETAVNDYDRIMPWAAMRRCNTAVVNGERVPTYFEGEVGYSNTEADVYVYVPRFWYYRSADDSEHVVSMTRLKGYRVPSKFIRSDGTLRDHVFLAAYALGMEGDVPVSRAGYYPHSATLGGFMTTICKGQHTAGTLDADVWVESMKDDEIRCILLDTEFGTRDHQSAMMGAVNMRSEDDQATAGGTNEITITPANAAKFAVGQEIAIGTSSNGGDVMEHGTITAIDAETGKISFNPPGEAVTVEVGNYVSSRPWKTGACDSVKASSGSPGDNASGKYPCVWRGCENPWGNVRRFRYDVLKSSSTPYVLDNPENFSTTVGDHHTALSYAVGTSDGYIKAMGYDSAFPFARLPVEVGGTSSTYFADQYHYASFGRVTRIGGANTGGKQGGSRSIYLRSTAADEGNAALSPA